MGDTDAKTIVERPQSGPGAEPPAAADATLPSRYIAKQEIGRGGMGRVVEATDELLGRTVAIKQALTLDSDALRRFKRETRITARLEHPSIVPVYDAGDASDGTPYYVMRKVTGQRLDKLVTDSLDQRLSLLPSLLAATQAVAHAHARGVVHRDIKPSNILVGELGETIVIDWGLAKVIGEEDRESPHESPLDAGGSLRTRIGAVIGTPGFMSPEQARGDAVDARSDVFALGATLYYVLSRRFPHQSASEDAVMIATAERAVEPIERVIAGVPSELATICAKALAFEHAHRYADAAALAEDLQRFLAGQLVASHHYSAWQRIGRFVRRNAVPVATASLAVLALVVGGTIAVRRVIAARDEAVSQSRRADEMRAREADRANEVTLGQARLLLDSNPTAAVALVKPLARTKYWREVRAIGADAHSSGVATKLPGTELQSVQLFPDGKRAVAISRHGDIWVYDLAASTGRVVATTSVAGQLAALDDRYVLIFQLAGTLNQIVDVTTGAVTKLALDATIHDVDRHGATSWLVDNFGAAWVLTHATGALAPLDLPERIVELVPSADGSKLAVAGETATWILENGHAIKALPGRAHTIGFSEDGLHVAALVGSDLVELDRTTGNITTMHSASTVMSLALAHGVTYAAGIAGIIVDRVRPAGWASTAFLTGMWHGPGQSMLVASDNVIAVIRGTSRLDIVPPLLPVIAVSSSPGSRYLVAICRDSLLRFDLESITGEAYDATPDRMVLHAAYRDHTLFAIHPQGSDWIDLPTGHRTPGPAGLPLSVTGSESRSMTRLFVFDMIDGDSWLLRHDTAEIVPLVPSVSAASFLDDARLAVASKQGTVRLFDLTTNTHRTLVEHGGQPVVLLRTAMRPSSWVLAGFADGQLWRGDVAKGTSEVWQRAGHGWLRGEGLIAPDGRTYFSDGAKLMAWNRDGAIALIGTATATIDGLYDMDPTRFLVHTTIGDVFVVDIDNPELVPTVTMENRSITKAPGAHLIAHAKPGSGLVVVDSTINTSFRVARMNRGGDTADLAPDGRYVYAHPDDLWIVWELALPQTADETARWIDSLTNAVSSRGTALTWQ